MASTAPQDGLSQGQLIWREFRKRKLAVAALGVISLLMLVAVWAPFLANDRPLYYYGINRAAYQNAVRNCRGSLVELIQHKQQIPEQPVPDAVHNVTAVLLPLMIGMVSDADAAKLQDWREKFDRAAQDTNPATAVPALTALNRQLREELTDLKVQFANRLHFPVIASLGWLDILFMAWSLMTLLSPVWLRSVRSIPLKSLRFSVGWTVWLGVPLIAALGWYLQVPTRDDNTPYKDGRFAAQDQSAAMPLTYERVVWPPVPYGYGEAVTEKKYLRPPWFPAKKADAAEADPAKPKQPIPTTPWDQPHWVGTDQNGRDVLSRMIWGGRVSLSVGVVSVSIYVSIGIVIGAIAGYFRGVIDLIISRIIEVVICFPTFFFILTIVALRGPSIWNIMIVIGLTGWTGIARLIRAEFLRLVDQEFVLAGRALGYSPARLIFRHILPNAMAPVLVSAAFGVAGAILTESALSFLGLGITIPVPSWGSLLLDGRNSEWVATWLIFVPGFAIFLTITCYNLVGEALRDASDPRLRGSR